MKIDKRNNLITKLAYIAGFVDGEGCIRIKKSNQSGNSYYITLQVTNSSKKVLELIQSIFGGKVYFQERSKNKIIWQYYASCSEATDILKTITGYLIDKKIQAELAIDFHDNQYKYSPDKKKELYLLMRNLKVINIYEHSNLLKGE